MIDYSLDAIARQMARATSRRRAIGVAMGASIAWFGQTIRHAWAQDHAHGTPAPASSPRPATPVASSDPGALIRASVDGLVGVLLEDVPAGVRDDLAASVLGKPDDWWAMRARRQLELANYRLIYRYYFHEEEKGNLPLPPIALWQITLDPAGPQRTTVDGHDVVAVEYHFESTLLSDAETPAQSEPALAELGGIWRESIVFPVDPLHIVQRTGFACMDEAEYPPETVSEDSAGELYDDTCDVEDPAEPICHYSEPYPTESCVDALIHAVGHVETTITFERLPWDAMEADRWRLGTPTSADTPDYQVVIDETGLGLNHVVYRYIAADHCAFVEGCVGNSGWRRLINFNAKTHNVGGGAMAIGELDYANEGFATELIDHNVYQWATCHGHYHFQHYGRFGFDAPGALENSKNGFCIESTDRLSNNETTPLVSPYSCYNQGTPSGWGDSYISSIVCNWVDVTDVDTSEGPIASDLSFAFNPEGFLCEGTVELDENGDRVWEETEFTTASGDIVSRPICDATPGSDGNNIGAVPVTLPAFGGTMSQPCRDTQSLGPLRNCGFTMNTPLLSCEPGSRVVVRCTTDEFIEPQAIRLCETSRVIGAGVDCSYGSALANAIAEENVIAIEAECPRARDSSEPGGEIAVYAAPIDVAGQVAPFACELDQL